MSKVVLEHVTAGYGAVDILNNNFDKISTALDNTLSRDGTAPNTWLTSQDANSKRLINLPAPQSSSDPVRLVDLQGAAVTTDFPSQSGNSGKFLKTDGTSVSWATVDASIVAFTASNIANVPAGNISATNVQTALNELDTEKAALASPIFTGTPSLPTGATGVTQAVGDNSTRLATTAFVNNSLPSGIVMDYAGSLVPTGWLECDGSAVSRTTYASLFAAIGTVFGAGNGSTTFNIPNASGRVRVGKGTVTHSSSGVDADVILSGTNTTFTVASNDTKWITGMAIVFTLSSGTVTGLTSGNTYYIIRNSATTVKLASSLANAQNGTGINITAKSSPVWTITYTGTSYTTGTIGGEETHAMSINELLSHQHNTSYAVYNNSANTTLGAGASTQTSSVISVTATGGNQAMNNMSPHIVLTTIIKI